MKEEEIHRIMFFVLIIVIIFFGIFYHKTTKPYLTNTQIFYLITFGIIVFIFFMAFSSLKDDILKNISGGNKAIYYILYVIIGIALIFFFRYFIRGSVNKIISN